jgi:hypothetical protein
MENMKLGVTKEDDLLTPFQIIVRLSFFTLSLTIRNCAKYHICCCGLI